MATLRWSSTDAAARFSFSSLFILPFMTLTTVSVANRPNQQCLATVTVVSVVNPPGFGLLATDTVVSVAMRSNIAAQFDRYCSKRR